MTALFAAAPPELAAGRYPAPSWVILTVAGVVLAFTVVALYLRFRRRADKGER